MKNFIVLSLITLLVTSLNAQIVNRGYNSKDFEQLLNSTLTVILIGDEEYDENIKKSISKYWKQTEYEFVSIDEINKIIGDEKRSFILPLKFGVTFDMRPSEIGHEYTSIKSWVSIINGGKKNINRYIDNDAVCLAPVSMYSGESAISASTDRMDYIIKGINDVIGYVIKEELTGGAAQMPFKTIKEINKLKNVIKDKTLIINAEAKNSYGSTVCSEKALKKYPYKYKLVSDKEYKEIMNSSSEEYLCLVPIFEVNKHIMIVEPSTKKTVYYAWSMQGMTVKSKDIKKLVK